MRRQIVTLSKSLILRDKTGLIIIVEKIPVIRATETEIGTGKGKGK